ncbi:Tubulointerstitial nephritis antigen-like [Homalodisca vitripennis]|nr:Tubulointerstitial nephritis antigen-like [Homalodisca vitripennis]
MSSPSLLQIKFLDTSLTKDHVLRIPLSPSLPGTRPLALSPDHCHLASKLTPKRKLPRYIREYESSCRVNKFGRARHDPLGDKTYTRIYLSHSPPLEGAPPARGCSDICSAQVVILAVTLLALGVAGLSDLSDIPGSYCGLRRIPCCTSREDSCSVPILGTLCYCDQFCNRAYNDDCCPDYRYVCLNETRTTTSPPQTIAAKPSKT